MERTRTQNTKFSHFCFSTRVDRKPPSAFGTANTRTWSIGGEFVRNNSWSSIRQCGFAVMKNRIDFGTLSAQLDLNKNREQEL